ncbi:MAG: site-specific tyrosine recombinase/integron integrase [bacterium]
MDLIRKRGYYKADFLSYIAVERNLSPRTIKEYEADLNIFFDFFKPYFEQELTLENLEERSIRDFLAYLKMEHHYTAKSLNRKIAALRSFFKYLEDEKIIPRSPMGGIKSAKLEKHLPKVLSESEVRDLLEAPVVLNNDKGIRDKAVLEILYATGIRISELVGLNLESIDMENLTMRVRGKGSKDRLVLFNESAAKAIEAYLAVRPNTSLNALFLSRAQKRMSRRTIEYIFEEYLERAGIHKSASPHTLRHSFATHMLEGGSDLMTIKELLGHENLSTTQIYTNISLQHIRETYRKSHPRK